ncbi:hypothetical protein KM043_005570 [Ampulex compressa]|nr:hypothetical protein KM043_005570 [Ampulex compressa]
MPPTPAPCRGAEAPLLVCSVKGRGPTCRALSRHPVPPRGMQFTFQDLGKMCAPMKTQAGVERLPGAARCTDKASTGIVAAGKYRNEALRKPRDVPSALRTSIDRPY